MVAGILPEVTSGCYLRSAMMVTTWLKVLHEFRHVEKKSATRAIMMIAA
jgi:hypothetical protein